MHVATSIVDGLSAGQERGMYRTHPANSAAPLWLVAPKVLTWPDRDERLRHINGATRASFASTFIPILLRHLHDILRKYLSQLSHLYHIQNRVARIPHSLLSGLFARLVAAAPNRA